MSFDTILVGEMRPDMMWPACRLEHRGAVAFGIEAIADAFRRAPFGVDGAQIVEGTGATALLDDDAGIFAEHVDGVVTRLWRVGNGTGERAEPALIVPFDPDLRQARGSIVFDAVDHPDFAPDAADRLIDAVTALAPPADDNFRQRAFVIRAFGSNASGAALVALQGLAHPLRRPTSASAIVAWTPDGARHVRDTPWFHGARGSLAA